MPFCSWKTFVVGSVVAVMCPAGVSAQTVAPAAAIPQPTSAATVPPTVASDPLLDQVDQAISLNSKRFLTANHHSPWQIFHGLLAYHGDFLLKVGDQKQSAIDWIATADPKFDGRSLILVTPHGAKFHPFTRAYAFEGHQMQTLALLSESHLPVEFTFKAGEKTVKLADFIQSAMMEVNGNEEVTWVLWGLNNYLRPDARWTNQHGETWSIERLVKIEVGRAVVGGPCGGNHNLFALSRARDKYLKTGQPLRGAWFEASQKINQYIEIARSLQNTDGSLSAGFYAKAEYSRDMNTRFNTTGHTMEFLSVGLPDNRLNEQWVRNAVHVLSRELIEHRRASVDCGPLYHSLNALTIYRNRVRPLPAPVTAALTPEKPVAPTAQDVKPETTTTPLASSPTVSNGPKIELPTPATEFEAPKIVKPEATAVAPKPAIERLQRPVAPPRKLAEEPVLVKLPLATLEPGRVIVQEEPADALAPLNR